MLSLAYGQAWTQGAKPSFEATLRLEKSVYVLGEAVRFWVGVRSTNGHPIPEEVRNNPCRLFVTKPDRSTETLIFAPALDRILGATGTEGGIRLDTSMEGTYVLVWECSNQKTVPVELSVEKNEIFDEVKTEFKFERSGTIRMGTSIPVIMRVENNSAYPIRFPQRGAMGEEVSVGAIREEPSSYWMGFYPDSKLSPSTIAPLTYTWDVAADIPSVVLQPGEHFEQMFLFEDPYSFDQPGNYRLMVSTDRLPPQVVRNRTLGGPNEVDEGVPGILEFVVPRKRIHGVPERPRRAPTPPSLFERPNQGGGRTAGVLTRLAHVFDQPRGLVDVPGSVSFKQGQHQDFSRIHPKIDRGIGGH